MSEFHNWQANPNHPNILMQDYAAIELMKYACDNLWRLPEEWKAADTVEKRYDLAADQAYLMAGALGRARKRIIDGEKIDMIRGTDIEKL